MAWKERTTSDLKYQIERLQRAADITSDPALREQHLQELAALERVLKDRAAEEGGAK